MGYWLLVMGYCLLIVGYWLLVIGYGLRVMGYGLWIMVYGLWSIGYGLLVFGYGLWVIAFWLWVMGYWLLLIGYWLLVMGCGLLVIGDCRFQRYRFHWFGSIRFRLLGSLMEPLFSWDFWVPRLFGLQSILLEISLSSLLFKELSTNKFVFSFLLFWRDFAKILRASLFAPRSA